MDDIIAFMGERNKEVTEGGVREGFEAVDHGMRKGRKNKMIASCSNLEETFQACSKKGVTLATSVETLGVDQRTRNQAAGSEKRSREEKSAR